MDGRFEGKSLVVDIEIISPLFKNAKKTLSVFIDTGCTGDLMLTYKEAFPLALTLVGIQDYKIADGSKVTFFECIGLVRFGSKTVLTTVSIRPSGSALMGVSLMKKLGIKLEVDFVNEKITLYQMQAKQLSSKANIKAKKDKQ